MERRDVATRPGVLSSKLQVEALDAPVRRAPAIKLALAPKETLLNSYFYSQTSSQSYDTPLSPMPISSS